MHCQGQSPFLQSKGPIAAQRTIPGGPEAAVAPGGLLIPCSTFYFDSCGQGPAFSQEQTRCHILPFIEDWESQEFRTVANASGNFTTQPVDSVPLGPADVWDEGAFTQLLASV